MPPELAVSRYRPAAQPAGLSQQVAGRRSTMLSSWLSRKNAQLEKSVARYLAQLDTADLQEPSEELAAKTTHLKEKLVKLESEMKRPGI
jgi:hypothetical protein